MILNRLVPGRFRAERRRRRSHQVEQYKQVDGLRDEMYRAVSVYGVGARGMETVNGKLIGSVERPGPGLVCPSKV